MLSRGPRIVGHPKLLPEELWRLALSDAAIAADRTVLFVLPGQSPKGDEASSWVPGTAIDAPEEVAGFGKLIHVANAPDVLGLHRIAIWPSTGPQEVSAALLRHELEHSRQFDRHGTAVRDLFLEALELLADIAQGVDGAGVLYQHIPMERDADAAASRFVRTLYGDEAVDAKEKGHWSLLARDGHAPDTETIRSRMEGFVEAMGPNWRNGSPWESAAASIGGSSAARAPSKLAQLA